MKAFVTDSSSMLDAHTASEWGVRVIPLGVTLDGDSFEDGVTLSTDEYYRRVAATSPVVTTSQPSPGQFVRTYEELVVDGATEIHSVHVGEKYSGTLNSARLAAAEIDVPVHLYDSGTSSYGVAVALGCVTEAVRDGQSPEQATRAMEQRTDVLRTCFYMDRVDVSARGMETVPSLNEDTALQTIWTIKSDQLLSVGEIATMRQAAELMLTEALKGSTDIHVAVGIGDLRNQPFAEDIDELASSETRVLSMRHYRVGPAVAAYLGPNSAGIFWYPQ
jgi:fatty acid kinase fatty acid binding subunit